MNLDNKKAYYILVSACSDQQDDYTNKVQSSRLEDSLYLKEYSILKLGNGDDNISYLGYKESATTEDNNELRYNAIELIDNFYQSSVIVKYYNEKKPKKILKDGSERPVRISKFNGDMENSYYNEGFSFSFIDEQEYFQPKKISDIEIGMIVEVKNNKNEWIPREVVNPEKEWDNMYSLLVKYDRIRILKNI